MRITRLPAPAVKPVPKSALRPVPAAALAAALALSLSGCGLFPARVPESGPDIALPRPPATEPVQSGGPVPVSGQAPAKLDGASEADLAAATAAPVRAGRELGRVTVSLGSPADQGFWLKTSLVTVPAKGRVVLANGRSVAVNLVPAEGAAVLSFSAYRALELALTDLPLVTVLAE
jgi:hypothetical protein